MQRTMPADDRRPLSWQIRAHESPSIECRSTTIAAPRTRGTTGSPRQAISAPPPPQPSPRDRLVRDGAPESLPLPLRTPDPIACMLVLGRPGADSACRRAGTHSSLPMVPASPDRSSDLALPVRHMRQHSLQGTTAFYRRPRPPHIHGRGGIPSPAQLTKRGAAEHGTPTPATIMVRVG